MKYASTTFIVLGLVTAGITACASSETFPFGSGGFGGSATSGGTGGNGGTATTTTTTGTTTTTTTSSSTGGPMCVPQCNTDLECQNSCPTPTSGVNCCDGATNTCYITTSTSCPSSQLDGGMPDAMY